MILVQIPNSIHYLRINQISARSFICLHLPRQLYFISAQCSCSLNTHLKIKQPPVLINETHCPRLSLSLKHPSRTLSLPIRSPFQPSTRAPLPALKQTPHFFLPVYRTLDGNEKTILPPHSKHPPHDTPIHSRIYSARARRH